MEGSRAAQGRDMHYSYPSRDTCACGHHCSLTGGSSCCTHEVQGLERLAREVSDVPVYGEHEQNQDRVVSDDTSMRVAAPSRRATVFDARNILTFATPPPRSEERGVLYARTGREKAQLCRPNRKAP